VSAAAAALSELYEPVKMNYEVHGNTIPHLHVHLFPRYAGDPYEHEGLGRLDASFTRTESELERIGRAVQTRRRGQARA
jgi:diadenosine tetraphosphate (Ap4A) HIT family hydrolase